MVFRGGALFPFAFIVEEILSRKLFQKFLGQSGFTWVGNTNTDTSVDPFYTLCFLALAINVLK